MSHQPGRQHSGVVSYQQVARPQQFRQIVKNAVFKALGRAHKMKQAGGGAIQQRFLGNQFGGKREIEIGDKHVPIIEAIVQTLTGASLTATKRNGSGRPPIVPWHHIASQVVDMGAAASP